MDAGAERIEIPGVDLERVIGRGASSVVYVGTQVRFGRSVAVKVLHLPGQSELVTRLFLNECRTLGHLTPHPNIVTVFDGGFVDEERPYLVMEYLPGGTLAARLAAEGPVPTDEVLRIGVQLAGGLQTTHLHDIVHGDIKPQNVLRTRSGEVALADFGIARLTTAAAATTRSPLLTPLHAAPELFEGGAATVRTDVYELCSTLFELLDGRPAVGDDSESPLVIVARLARHERRSLDRDVVPGRVAEIIESGLAPDPDERPASAAELGELLQDAQRSLGQEVTRLVVIEQLPVPAVGPTPVSDDAAERAGAAATSASGSASSMEGPAAHTLPPPGARTRRRWVVVGAACAVVVLAGVAWAIVASSGGGGPAARVSGAAATRDAATSTTKKPVGTSYAGIQPDVTYDVPDHRDVSGVLAARLGDPATLVAPLGDGITVVDAPTFSVERLPATVRWQAFNPRATRSCAGVLSDPLTVVGLWEKAGKWPRRQVNMRVVELATVSQASQAFAVFSVEQGVDAPGCSGFAVPFGDTDASRIDVRHQDQRLPLPEGVRYNSWVGPPPAGMAEVTSVSSAIVQVGTRVALVAVSSGQDLVTPEQLGAFLTGVVQRLED